METYSSSNAAARNPEESVQLNKPEHFTINYLQKLFKQHVKEKRKASQDEDWSDLEWPKSPAKNLYIPEHPRTACAVRIVI